MKIHGIERIKLHGEADDADDLSNEEVEALMGLWRNELRELIEEKGVGPSCLYNADHQTGLFYQKLPNALYVQKNNKKFFKGTKQMKDKTRVTTMICTAADGTRVPIAILGRRRNLHVFNCLTLPLQCLSHTRNRKMHGLIRASHFGGSIVSSGLSI